MELLAELVRDLAQLPVQLHRVDVVLRRQFVLVPAFDFPFAEIVAEFELGMPLLCFSVQLFTDRLHLFYELLLGQYLIVLAVAFEVFVHVLSHALLLQVSDESVIVVGRVLGPAR